MDNGWIEIVNAGPDIARTNYFDTHHARHGLYYLNWNAGAARLLVPDSAVPALEDMRTTKRSVIVTRGMLDGMDAYELFFDDDSQDPFSVTADARHSDRTITDVAASFTVVAWTRQGKAASWPGHFRIAPTLPFLEPWNKRPSDAT